MTTRVLSTATVLAAMLAFATSPAAIAAAPNQAPAPASASTTSPQAPGGAGERTPTSVQFTGWERTSVEVASSGDGDRRHDEGEGDVPHDAIVARQLLNLRTRYTRGRAFEAVGTGLIRAGLFEPVANALYRNDTLRGDVSAEVREAYLGFFTTRVDLRAGIQRIAWGHADMLSPNDVVDGDDIRDPVLGEPELWHTPTLSLRADLSLAFGSLQFVAKPFLEPDRYDVYGTNWALVQSDAPAGYRGLLGALSRQLEVSPQDAGKSLLVDTPRPGGLAGSQGGLRFDWKAGRVDLTQYYEYGYNGMPNFRIDPAAGALLEAVDWAHVSPDQVQTSLAEVESSNAVGSRWERRHHVGLDVGTTKGPFALRVDAAYQHPALFYDQMLNGWLSPSAQAVVGVEYQTGDLGRSVVLECRYRHLTREPPASGLLFVEQNSGDAALLVRWTWASRIELETRALAGLGPSSYVFRPQIAWKHNSLALRVGLLLLGGDERSYGAWYGQNRSMYVMLRKAF